MNVRTRLLPIAAALIAFTGCADVGKTMRKITYPPDFTYLQHEDVESAMWRLAAGVRELDQTLRDKSIGEPAKRERILEVLERMQRASADLDAQGGASNHPLLDRKLPRLGADISAARLAATGEPPSYELSAAVSGACIYCHAARVPVQSSRQGSSQ
jgi:hypothetical protein